MADDITRDLVVYLQSISYSGSTSSILLSDPIDIFIDSTDPNLWLPEKVCEEFEKAFGLTMDNDTGLYLVNDTHNTELLNSDAEVTFRLSDVGSGGDAVAITLPYEAFALTAKPPLVGNISYYFPLKRAENSTQYTLGRVFLQEAYLSADYERGVFNVSACSWKEDAEENIVEITSKDADSSGCSGSKCTSSSGDGTGNSGNSSGLSRGAVAGISVGAAIGFFLLLGTVIFYIRRHRQKSKNKAIDPKPNVSVLSGPVHNGGPPESSSHEHESSGQDTFWSPDTINSSSGLNTSRHNESSGESGHREDEFGENELDGHDTQIKPVYHELAGSKVPDVR
ncbi:uncharacterized protein N7469_003340 [Penicillium citrinum]|uniref:Peptidase A1 domain-containing protein n=2 Tax=Penicillium TaxID=5073 RepID=A0A9W9TPS5_PENCI|nr:uncharacterized protein N7469_003340 [Penicillium citrinum]KAJ5234172.1 hypothetical protein N7469_003340 [Penicillium citrinum]KAJ5589779.1 hypothetical protein N7450_003751 [Penicillium hetheringtonii]